LPPTPPLSTVEAVSATPAGEQERAVTPRRAVTRARRVRLASWLTPTSNTAVYAGLALIVIGFAVLAWTWSRVAGTAIVALQLPYLASGGFSGLGLLVIGTLLIYLGVKRRDAWTRERRLEALAAALRAAGGGDPDADPDAGDDALD
jgi:hypothetical protein